MWNQLILKRQWKLWMVSVARLHWRNNSFWKDVEGVQDELVLADPVRLRQILINLISNAVKYTPFRGHIQVKVKQSNSPIEGKLVILL